MKCNHKSIIETDICLMCKNLDYLYKYSNDYLSYTIKAEEYYSSRYFSTDNVGWNFDIKDLISNFATISDFSNPIKQQAQEIVNKDPYMVRIRDEVLHLEKLLQEKQHEVAEYEKFTLEKTYNKLLKNKAFL